MSSEKNISNNNELNINKLISNYTKYWYWFLISCIVFLVGAFFQLRYSTPKFKAYAKIMILEDENTTSPASALLNDLKTFSQGENTKVEDEIEILKSRKLMESVVKELELNVSYYAEGRFHETQFYPNSPIKINFFEHDSIVAISSLKINLNVVSDTQFNYSFKDEELTKKGFFGKSIASPIGEFVITPTTAENISSYKGRNLYIKIKPIFELAESYRNAISINQAGEYSKIVNLSLTDAVSLKAKRIINKLISEYNKVSINDRNKKSENTAKFIDERINLISKDLSDADDRIERFKTGNKLTDIVSEADLYLNSSAQTEQELDIKKTERSKLSYMKDLLGDDNSFTSIPSNLGLSDNSINLLADKYNELLNNRERLLKSSKEKNPTIVNLDQELNNIRNSLKQNLDNSSKSINLEIRSLENRSSKINSKISAVPSQIRKSREIERKKGTKEALYLYLLEKKEEAKISLTSTSPKVKVIDKAYSPPIPVSPKRKMAYIAAVFVGLCIPFSVIYLKYLLDNKINNKEDLQEIIKNITVLGEIPNFGKKENGLIRKNDRSIMSESFRIIRTNFDYVKRGRNVKANDNVLFVSSTINSEGKSFVSLNMALTLANTEKRVLLIGADIRNPQIYSAIKNKTNKNQSNKIGLTEYLVDDSIILGEAINSYNINNISIDIMLSGKVPPNPAELLMSDRMKTLFDAASEQYDYVIVDTAPAMLVTDTLLISQYAGHTIYVTRAGYTEKRILNFAKELHAENKLSGMMLVVNDVKQSNFGYGAKYGYYGAPKKKGWFRRRA